MTNSGYRTQIAEKALAGEKYKEAEQNEKKKAKKKKNLKKKPNKSTRKEFRKMLRMTRKDSIEEDDIDMSTNEEVAEKENGVKENKTETKVACSGIYPKKRNESVNSPLTFSNAELMISMSEKILLCTDHNQRPTIGENCSKYFPLR